jgi:hypothetical protein
MRTRWTSSCQHNAIIVGGVVDVVKTFTSANDTATHRHLCGPGQRHCGRQGDQLPRAMSGTRGCKAIIPKANTPESTGIKLAADTPITVTVGVSRR